jgi:hypothetical protein
MDIRRLQPAAGGFRRVVFNLRYTENQPVVCYSPSG